VRGGHLRGGAGHCVKKVLGLANAFALFAVALVVLIGIVDSRRTWTSDARNRARRLREGQRRAEGGK